MGSPAPHSGPASRADTPPSGSPSTAESAASSADGASAGEPAEAASRSLLGDLPSLGRPRQQPLPLVGSSSSPAEAAGSTDDDLASALYDFGDVEPPALPVPQAVAVPPTATFDPTTGPVLPTPAEEVAMRKMAAADSWKAEVGDVVDDLLSTAGADRAAVAGSGLVRVRPDDLTADALDAFQATVDQRRAAGEDLPADVLDAQRQRNRLVFDVVTNALHRAARASAVARTTAAPDGSVQVPAHLIRQIRKLVADDAAGANIAPVGPLAWTERSAARVGVDALAACGSRPGVGYSAEEEELAQEHAKRVVAAEVGDEVVSCALDAAASAFAAASQERMAAAKLSPYTWSL